MSDETVYAHAKALELIAEVSERELVQLSKDQIGTLVAAIKGDLNTLANKSKVDEERLAKVERQARSLSEAVIAITAASVTSDTLASAVQAVKDEM